MTHVICRLTAKNRDQLRNPTLGNRIWATFTFLPFDVESVGHTECSGEAAAKCSDGRGKVTLRVTEYAVSPALISRRLAFTWARTDWLLPTTSPPTFSHCAPSSGSQTSSSPHSLRNAICANNVSVNVNVKFKATLHEQVRCRGTLQYQKLQSVIQLDTMVKCTMTETVPS